MDYKVKMKKGSKASPGAAYMKGRKPNTKDPSCPSSGYVYGHSKFGGDSPSPSRKKG